MIILWNIDKSFEWLLDFYMYQDTAKKINETQINDLMSVHVHWVIFHYNSDVQNK